VTVDISFLLVILGSEEDLGKEIGKIFTFEPLV
jgi:hypothetical protein